MIHRKILHAADVHLDSPLLRLESYPSAPIEQIRTATRHALTNLVNLAIQESVDLVVIAGDIYDGDWNDISTGMFFVQQASRLVREGIPLVMIRGNHDAQSLMTTSLPLPCNPDGKAVLLDHLKADHRLFEKIGVVVHGQSFATKAVMDDLSANYPSPFNGLFNLGLLHTSLTGAEEHATYSPCTPSQLIDKGYDYWALGHIHDRRECHPVGETPIVFAGNIQGRHVRETGPKGCLILSIDDQNRVSSQFHPLDVFRWQVFQHDAALDTSTDELMDSFVKWLQRQVVDAEHRPLAVRVVVAGESALHGTFRSQVDRLEADLRSMATIHGAGQVWFEQLKVKTSPLKQKSAQTETTAEERDALQSVRMVVDSIRRDSAEQSAIVEPLKRLWRRLPPELLTDLSDPFSLEREDLRMSWLDAAECSLVEQSAAPEVAS